MGWQHGHVGPVWLSEPMFVALGDLEKLFAFRASTKEVHDGKCSGYFFAVQQRRATYFSIQGFTGVDNYQACRIAPQFFLSHSGSGSSQKVVIGVYRFRTVTASIAPGGDVESVYSRASSPGGLATPACHVRTRQCMRATGFSRTCYPGRSVASHGGALNLRGRLRRCVPPARLTRRRAKPLRTGTRPNASRTPHAEAR